MEALFGAALGVVASALAHFAALRSGARPLSAYGASLFTGAIVSLILSGIFGHLLQRSLLWSALTAIVLFISWWFVLLNFIQTSVSSLRVHLLREFMSQGGVLSRDALARRYNDDLILRMRLDRMVEAGAVVRRDGHLFVESQQLKLLARFFRILKIVVTGRRSEFDVVEPSQARLP